MGNILPARPAYPGPSLMIAAPGRVGQVWESYCTRSSVFPAA